MVCLDTTFLIDLADGDRKALAMWDSLRDEQATIATTFLNVGEIEVGLLHQDTPEAERKAFGEFLSEIAILWPSYQTPHLYARMVTNAIDRGRRPSIVDAWIAATAVSNGHPVVVTRDKGYAGLEGLEIRRY